MQPDGTKFPTIMRRIVTIDGRRVHLRHAGEGPHVLLIHGSPASSEFLLPTIARLSRRYSCLAPDTPGFGESDTLPVESRTIAATAMATAELLESLGFAPCLVVGTHTGAAIALELAMQRPDLVGGLLLDGVALFNSAEHHLFDGYFEPVVIDARGGHFARTWTRIRDMFIWFPWTSHAPDRLNGMDLPPVASTHRWVSMLFQAAPHYAELYRAAIAFTDQGLKTAAAQTRPAIYLAHEHDMLAPHLLRLPTLKQGDRVEQTSSAPGEWAAAVERALADLECVTTIGSGPLRPARVVIGAAAAADQFIDLAHGQLRVRRFGSSASPALLLLHDAPGSGLMLRGLAQAMANHWCVWVPDLPGCGASQPLSQAEPTLEDYASSLDEFIGTIAAQPLAVYGRGCGAAVAVCLAERHPARYRHIVLDELLIADPTAAAPDARVCPRITLEADGSHWFRTWQMLRDSQIFWPWYETSARGLLRLPGDFSREFLHEWTTQVLQQPATAHCLPQAALAVNAVARLTTARWPVTLMARRGHPLAQRALRFHVEQPGVDFVAYPESERAVELDRCLFDGPHPLDPVARTPA